jgi:hypothetical protein
LTRRDLADRAELPAWYVEYLETEPTARPSARSIASVALALGIPAGELLDGGVDQSMLSDRPTHLVEVGLDQCWQRLADSGIGRIVFDAEEGPVALPVNYALSRHDILFRTSEDSVIAKIKTGACVGFEVDCINEEIGTGWSIFVQATCEHLGREHDGRLEVQVDPFVGGQRGHWICLRSHSIAGRLIEADA